MKQRFPTVSRALILLLAACAPGFGEEMKLSDKNVPVSLDCLVDKTPIWDLKPEQVETQFKETGFRWLSESSKDRGMIRPSWLWLKKDGPAKSEKGTVQITMDKQQLKLFDGRMNAEEVNFDFKKGSLGMVTISLWNKGDSDDIGEKFFNAIVSQTSESLTGRLGVKPQDLGKDKASASKAMRVRWELPQTVVQLEYSSDKKSGYPFQGEFIRLRLVPKVKTALGTDANANVAQVSLGKLVDRVKKTDKGDVYIDAMPMVDQGEKGYCALATSERVFKYYGIQCDQHDLAQAAGAGSYGTSPEELQEALHKLQTKFKVRVKDVIHWDFKDYQKFTETYNREAKKAGVRQCPPNYFLATFRGLDPKALRETRGKGGAYDKFHKSIVDATSQGVPLLWGLELGVYPENGEPALQDGGGHMRLIIGYNEKTEEVIFTDSWGAGHEVKRMNMRDAQAVTNGLYIIEPQAR
jgi:hypothetical protein